MQNLHDYLLAIGKTAELWHTGNEAYMTTPQGTYKIPSADCDAWLRWRYYQQTDSAIASSILNAVVRTLYAIAKFQGQGYDSKWNEDGKCLERKLIRQT